MQWQKAIWVIQTFIVDVFQAWYRAVVVMVTVSSASVSFVLAVPFPQSITFSCNQINNHTYSCTVKFIDKCPSLFFAFNALRKEFEICTYFFKAYRMNIWNRLPWRITTLINSPSGS
jgi:hypothetical protein